MIEFAGIGPAPMAALLLAEMGAEIVRIHPVQAPPACIPLEPRHALLERSRRSIAIDLKQPAGLAIALDLIARADALIEGFRPGVMERLGLAPEVCWERNAALIYGRVTGWGQEGPLAGAPGHDLNFIALSGVASAIGPPDGPPVPPLNLVGDFGGGGAYLALGIVAAMLEARRSGRGQVVEAAMVDCAASLMTAHFGMRAAGVASANRGTNILDGGAHFYRSYETAEGRYVSVAAIEERFYTQLLAALGLEDPEGKARRDPSQWPEWSRRFAAVFRTRTRAEWCDLLEGTDSCFAPVLDLEEAPGHAHMEARGTFVWRDDVLQPAPAPRFSRTPSNIQGSPRASGADTDEVLRGLDYSPERLADLRDKRVIR
jgi:alpha-methylacyl-CoA racemase